MSDGYRLGVRVPSTFTELSPGHVLMERAGPDESVWVPDPRPVPEALTDTFTAKPYRDPFLVPVLEKLDQASLETLSRILGGWPVNPDD